MDRYYYNLKRQIEIMEPPSQSTHSACGCQCGGLCQSVPSNVNSNVGISSSRVREVLKALEKNVDPAILLLILGQAYVMTEAQNQKRERNQFAYMAIGSFLNLVIYNLSN